MNCVLDMLRCITVDMHLWEHGDMFNLCEVAAAEASTSKAAATKGLCSDGHKG